MKLSSEQLRDFADHGYVVARGVLDPGHLEAATREIDRLIADAPPAPDHVGHHFYWLKASDGGPLVDLYSATQVHRLATSLVEPGEIGIAFDHVQVALNIPHFTHRPGGPHLDGVRDGQVVPDTFTILVGVLMTDQWEENGGNLWVWPGTHRTYAAYFRETGPDALVASGGYPKIQLPEPVQIVGAAGDVLLAHYMLGHNIGGNYAGGRQRRAVYFRLRRTGHAARWREVLCDEFLEFDAVRGAVA